MLHVNKMVEQFTVIITLFSDVSAIRRQVCRPKRAGIECRGAEHECDLSEYCTGNSEYCPDDVHKQNGLQCQNGEVGAYRL